MAGLWQLFALGLFIGVGEYLLIRVERKDAAKMLTLTGLTVALGVFLYELTRVITTLRILQRTYGL
ncbi:MAG: hypothetical protein PHI12_13280 [Dehalococcoidales bacterium]|nr:hypothetical protein [Dehalococcoidales bacterium]